MFIALFGVGSLALEWWTLGEITYGGKYAWVVVLVTFIVFLVVLFVVFRLRAAAVRRETE